MAETLKVLMMGGRRAGKTSVLAGLVNTMVNGGIKNLLTINDVTVLMPGQESLTDKIEHLKESVKSLSGKTFLVDDSKTNSFTTHRLQFEIPGTCNNMTIEFKDANGEFYESRASYDTYGGAPISKEQIINAVKEADVYVIAIDTPYLMEAVNPENELCDESINMAYNHVDDIHSYLTYIDDKDGADAKLVLFVPIKCEKWVHRGEADKVTQRIKDVYKTVFKALDDYKNLQVDIIPVETVGAIEFKEHQTAMICSNNDFVARKCCVLNDETEVRFGDGTSRRIMDGDIIADDPESRISEFHSIIRPYSWYHVTGNEYAPHNCEQLAYSILQFVLAKYLFLKNLEAEKKEQERKKKKWWKYAKIVLIAWFSIPFAIIYWAAGKLIEKMGSISYEELNALVNSIESRGLIKHNTEGICNVKKSKLGI
ncbi:MAG: hypothetical protein KBT20_07680 [Bacteroidales bacterium]|nr:hypothetical protein [Candidatus Liminaster caballi]